MNINSPLETFVFADFYNFIEIKKGRKQEIKNVFPDEAGDYVAKWSDLEQLEHYNLSLIDLVDANQTI